MVRQLIGRHLIGRCAVLVAALPAAAAGVLALAALVLSATGRNPDWPRQTVNMTEAAALRDQATVLRLIAAGEDPHARRELPADLVLNERADLTPFEAAIAAGRPEVAELLVWAGYRFDTAEWIHLRCLASGEGDEDIVGLLDAHRPEGAAAVPDCTGVRKPWTR